MKKLTWLAAVLLFWGACDDDDIAGDVAVCVSPQSASSYVERPNVVGNGRPAPLSLSCGGTTAGTPPPPMGGCETICENLIACGIAGSDCRSQCTSDIDSCAAAVACFGQASCDEIENGECNDSLADCT